MAEVFMAKEILFTNDELEPLAAGLTKTFIQRWDLYPRQLDDGSYICIHKSLQPRHLFAHLQGEITLGAYVLDQASQAKYIVLDADTSEQMKKLTHTAGVLANQGVHAYLEESRRGGHLWLFFARPMQGKAARLFGHNLIRRYSLSGIELFPKQDKAKEGPGSLVRLPFGIHRKTGERYGFLDANLQPLASSFGEQILKLRAPETVPDSFLAANQDVQVFVPQKAVLATSESLKPTLSERIKGSVSVHDFVSQYIDLSPNGRGTCPFHDDQHASFSVNAEKNYWHCFAGCGGGSIIDFWMRYRKCDFKTAIQELAGMLLKKG
jgi:hypothetical protein